MTAGTTDLVYGLVAGLVVAAVVVRGRRPPPPARLGLAGGRRAEARLPAAGRPAPRGGPGHLRLRRPAQGGRRGRPGRAANLPFERFGDRQAPADRHPPGDPGPGAADRVRQLRRAPPAAPSGPAGPASPRRPRPGSSTTPTSSPWPPRPRPGGPSPGGGHGVATDAAPASPGRSGARTGRSNAPRSTRRYRSSRWPPRSWAPPRSRTTAPGRCPPHRGVHRRRSAPGPRPGALGRPVPVPLSQVAGPSFAGAAPVRGFGHRRPSMRRPAAAPPPSCWPPRWPRRAPPRSSGPHPTRWRRWPSHRGPATVRRWRPGGCRTRPAGTSTGTGTVAAGRRTSTTPASRPGTPWPTDGRAPAPPAGPVARRVSGGPAPSRLSRATSTSTTELARHPGGAPQVEVGLGQQLHGPGDAGGSRAGWPGPAPSWPGRRSSIPSSAAACSGDVTPEPSRRSIWR